MAEVRWERMFRDQLEQRFTACPVLYLTYGLCEPHGPHNAVGLDGLKAHGLAVAAARAHGGIVAPPDYWHIHEIGGYARWGHDNVGDARTWLTSLPPWQHFKNVLYQIRAADSLEFEAVILLTGHYGPNWMDLKTLAQLVQPAVGARLYALPDFEANEPGFDGASGDHAGKVETSLLWALEPQCVDMSRLPLGGEPGQRFAMGADAGRSDRREGERMVADEVAWLGRKAQELLREFRDSRPAVRLRSFEAVEELWEREIRPRVPSFKSMQDRPGDASLPELPAASRWHTNWRVSRTG
ncbi:MAG: creatininase family protein [Candidatus Dormibacteraeota bacterium]|nr:creatininase family protein [Candidatus Dormibacteraeota bacterium]